VTKTAALFLAAYEQATRDFFCRAEMSEMSIGPIEKAFTCALRVSSRK
jgi:hypothetical protein